MGKGQPSVRLSAILSIQRPRTRFHHDLRMGRQRKTDARRDQSMHDPCSRHHSLSARSLKNGPDQHGCAGEGLGRQSKWSIQIEDVEPRQSPLIAMGLLHSVNTGRQGELDNRRGSAHHEARNRPPSTIIDRQGTKPTSGITNQAYPHPERRSQGFCVRLTGCRFSKVLARVARRWRQRTRIASSSIDTDVGELLLAYPLFQPAGGSRRGAYFPSLRSFPSPDQGSRRFTKT